MNEQLYKLLQKAREDAELRKRIWAVKEAKDPALALCDRRGLSVDCGWFVF